MVLWHRFSCGGTAADRDFPMFILAPRKAQSWRYVQDIWLNSQQVQCTFVSKTERYKYGQRQREKEHLHNKLAAETQIQSHSETIRNLNISEPDTEPWKLIACHSDCPQKIHRLKITVNCLRVIWEMHTAKVLLSPDQGCRSGQELPETSCPGSKRWQKYQAFSTSLWILGPIIQCCHVSFGSIARATCLKQRFS